MPVIPRENDVRTRVNSLRIVNLLWRSLFSTPGSCGKCDRRSTQRAQRSRKFEISSEIEIFEWDWKFRASHPPRPYFCGEFETSRLKFSSGIKKFDIENFERDWIFWSLGPLGNCDLAHDRARPTKHRYVEQAVGVPQEMHIGLDCRQGGLT